MNYTSENYKELSWNICGIYKITNIINGKCYIGQSVDIRKRWRAHLRVANTDFNLLHRAFQKYGVENFTFEIIEYCARKELNEREKYWINYYDSHNPDKGYNMTDGGTFLAEGKGANEKPVRAYLLTEKDEIVGGSGISFPSCNAAARALSAEFGFSYIGSSIGLVCQGKQFKHGYHTFCFLDENGEDIPTEYIYKGTTRIAVITPSNEVLHFKSVAEAERELGLERSNIFNALDYLDHRITKGNFINYRFYRENELPNLNELHGESLKDKMLNTDTNYTRIYKLTKPDGTEEYYTTVNEICKDYGIDKSVVYRNYNKTIGRGKFKGWRIDTIDKEGAIQTRVRSKN